MLQPNMRNSAEGAKQMLPSETDLPQEAVGKKVQ